jgi:hypothetical protein
MDALEVLWRGLPAAPLPAGAKSFAGVRAFIFANFIVLPISRSSACTAAPEPSDHLPTVSVAGEGS